MPDIQNLLIFPVFLFSYIVCSEFSKNTGKSVYLEAMDRRDGRCQPSRRKSTLALDLDVDLHVDAYCITLFTKQMNALECIVIISFRGHFQTIFKLELSRARTPRAGTSAIASTILILICMHSSVY